MPNSLIWQSLLKLVYGLLLSVRQRNDGKIKIKMLLLRGHWVTRFSRERPPAGGQEVFLTHDSMRPFFVLSVVPSSRSGSIKLIKRHPAFGSILFPLINV